ncbi:hypothetical protein RR48_08657 [Papilio machaon]|uniref:EF-hand domain-containing protein n=1 Tax=Papilio machaon TaxID=76193 RepID=A0A194R7N5_PAPMA|nr:hypothetical protein RR48_08657 [Papilio machaon]
MKANIVDIIVDPLGDKIPRFSEQHLNEILEWFEEKSQPISVPDVDEPINENRTFLDIDEIRVIATSVGQPFDEDETLELLRDANVRGDGNVYYEDFVESLFSLAPELYSIKAEYLFENPEEDPSQIESSDLEVPAQVQTKGKMGK